MGYGGTPRIRRWPHPRTIGRHRTFFGLMPLSIRSKSDLTGIELDDLSGHILRALYPEAHIHIEGFEQQRIPNNSYSLVISNVPFGTFKVHDTFDRDLSSRFEIHDYFIAKSIRKLKPGGLGVFITSTATLDRSANLRNWVVNDGNADFIGAVRLNTGTFKIRPAPKPRPTSLSSANATKPGRHPMP